jgi:sec-independent protein translocase protein TatC
MTIGEHLDELRWHVLRALGYVFVAAMVCFYFQEELVTAAKRPYVQVTEKMARERRVPDEGLESETLEWVQQIRQGDEALQAELEAAERAEAKLRERVDPSTETLKELGAEVEAIGAELAALREQQDALADQEPAAVAEGLQAIEAKRAGLVARYGVLEERIGRQVTPFVDRRARIPKNTLQQLSPQEYFLSALKLVLVAALFLASPLAVKELWTFISKGLYPKEKRYIKIFYPLSLAAFVAGAAFGYFLLVPLGLEFLLAYGSTAGIDTGVAVASYFSLFTAMILVVGLIFELPLAMTFMAMIGVMNAQKYRSGRRFFLLGAFVFGAFLTPPDPVTQCLMAMPMILLYELGIWLSVVFGAKSTREEAEQEPPAKGDGAAAVAGSGPGSPPAAKALVAPAAAPTVARGAWKESPGPTTAIGDGPVPVIPMESTVGALDSGLGDSEIADVTEESSPEAKDVPEESSPEAEDASDEAERSVTFAADEDPDGLGVPVLSGARFDPEAEDDDEDEGAVTSSAYREQIQRRAAEAGAGKAAPKAEGAASPREAEGSALGEQTEEGADA